MSHDAADESDREQARRAAVQDYAPQQGRADVVLDELTRLAALALDAPIALISIVEPDRAWCASGFGLEAAAASQVAAVAVRVVQAGQALVTADIAQDARLFEHVPSLRASGVGFFAGAPLRTPDGSIIGALCIMAGTARTATNELQLLELVAAQVLRHLQSFRQRPAREGQTEQPARDGSPQRAQETELATSNARFRALFESMEDGVIVQDHAGAVVSANPAAERILGRSNANLQGRSAHGPPLAPLIRRDGSPLPHEERPAAHVLRTGQAVTNRVMGLRISDSETTWISVNATPLMLPTNAAPSGAVMTFRDISEQVRLQEALEQSLENFRTLVASMPIGVAVSHGRTMRYVNGALVRILGYENASELEGRETMMVVHPNSQEAILERYAGMARGRHPGPGILECRKRDGSSVLVEVVSLASVFEGKPAIVALIRDVTESTRARQAQERSDARFRALVNVAPVGIYETNREGRCLYANEWLCGMTGLSLEDLLSNGWTPALHPDEADALQVERAQLLASPKPTVQDIRFVTPRGVVRTQVQAVPLLSDGEVSGFLCAVTDLTNLREAQAALARSEASFRALAARAPIGIGVRVDSTLTFANPALAAMAGLDSPEQMLGKNVVELMAPRSRAETATRISKLAQGERVAKSVLGLMRADASETLVELDSINVDFNGTPSTMTLIRDVTELEQARAERDAVHSRLLLSLAEKETLLKEIHHRVKNNLQVIASLLRLGRGYVKDPEALSVFNDSIARLHSIAQIHERLYQSSDLDRIEMGSYLKGLVTELVRANTTEHKVAAQILAAPLFLDMDRCVPLGLIVNELVSNALKHAFGTQPPRPPTLVVSLEEGEADYELVVRDNGLGFVIDEAREGSLGLRIVTSLTRQLRGTYRVEQSAGTAWHVVFPKESEG